MLPDLVIRHDRGGSGPAAVSREEIAGSSFGAHLPGRPDELVAEFRPRGPSPVNDGELPGVRSTSDEIIAQEVAGGCPVDVASAQVARIASDYDRDVRSGRDHYPLRRD